MAVKKQADEMARAYLERADRALVQARSVLAAGEFVASLPQVGDARMRQRKARMRQMVREAETSLAAALVAMNGAQRWVAAGASVKDDKRRAAVVAEHGRLVARAQDLGRQAAP